MKRMADGPASPTLRPLGTRCRGIPALAEHRVRTRVDNSGNVVQEETGWGPDPYAGNPEGWSFTYVFCAAREPGRS
jgi:hypothetical protein